MADLTADDDDDISASSQLTVVGIGASAGGLEALQHFFDNVSSTTTLSFVVVQHLSPDFKSLMDELLARHTTLPIHLVENAMVVEAGHVYLIPPKKEMIISGGRLLLSERDRQQELTLPIDVFFRSLAQDCTVRSIAIVLSGTGSDGSRGIRDVHKAGGLVVVQDLESAQFDGMPRTAQDTGIADWLVRPQDMPAILESHLERIDAMPPSVPARATASSAALGDVYSMLEKEFGIDFTHYKPSTVTRRIERRLGLAKVDDIQQYVTRLRGERGELDVLYRDLLIGVTRFFRNEQAFDILRQRVLPELLAGCSPGRPLRVWVAGCATGEEAYSIAILLHELTENVDRSFQIFATDVHRGSIEIAGRAFYPEASLVNVSPERRDRYFIRSGTSYQLVPELRQSIVFAPHNVIKDAPFTRVDLVSCRNMLIYFQPAVQQKVLNQFHFALNRGGIMFLGPSESPGALIKDFETVDQGWRMYRKHSDVRTPVDPRLRPRVVEDKPPQSTTSNTPFARYSMSNLLATYDVLLEDYMPPSLLVNDRNELLHAFGGASRFLKPRDGRQGNEILDQVDEDLRLVLAGGLRRALLSATPIIFKNLKLRINGEEVVHDISLRRVVTRNTEVANILISFITLKNLPVVTDEVAVEIGQVARDQLGALEAELDYTKDNLQAAIEQLETGNEELQASNEELMSSNEELQSTNEELQSVNEELYTVNAEYQSKITQLTELTNDMDNLLASTDVGTIFLDENLRIRKFTPQVAENFNLMPQDLGRSIETFTNNMQHPDFIADLRKVLATGERVEREVRDQHNRSYYLRVLPYRAKGGTSGLVITFIEISGLKAAEDALFHERYLLDSLLTSVPDAIYFRDTRGKFIRANPAFATRIGLADAAGALGKTPFEMPDPKAALDLHHPDEEVLRTGESQHYKLEQRTRADGAPQWDLATRLPLRGTHGEVVGVIGIFRDVTEQKLGEEKILEGVRRRDEFLAMLSHELRNPLASVVTATQLLKGVNLPQEHTRLIEVVDRQSNQMARLLDDLLEASRVTQNKVEIRRLPMDLRAVVEEAASAVRSMMSASDLAFSYDIDPRPLTIDGDAARLQQVCVNLLTNAAKYTPKGGRVYLRATREGTDAIIRIEDNGVGIPADMLKAVFELFVQSSRTIDRSQGGIGVGLTLARSLIDLHGGTIVAVSAGEGKGSSFTVRLPLSTHEIDELAVRKRGKVLARGSRIALVEDNEDTREMMCALLVRSGFEVRTAADGLAALDLIEEFMPHAAVVDVGLPGIDGFEVARRVRAKSKLQHVTLVALTGYGQQSDRATAIKAGFDAHLVKPVRLEQLLAILSKPDPMLEPVTPTMVPEHTARDEPVTS
ncbi:MAG: PAS domain-containing protein [Deltaproteobacteria bacterium]|nr:PAS domain-containing protein [Deltaproteobacteria bacterium]MDQ3299034.1 PAS domain-containing protein [Myxococcota bacterium]